MHKWKQCRQVYEMVMRGRHTDLMTEEDVLEKDRVSVTDAYNYIFCQTFPLIQPSKSRVVAIVYAFLLRDVYELDVYECLRDPELLTDDPFFATYDEDKQGYDLLLKELVHPGYWQDMGGWVERTIKYFWLECTEEGNNFACASDDEQLMEFLDDAECPLQISIY